VTVLPTWKHRGKCELTVAGNDLRNYNDAHSQCVHGGDDDLPAVEVAALCGTAAMVQLAQPDNRPTHLGGSIPTSCKPIVTSWRLLLDGAYAPQSPNAGHGPKPPDAAAETVALGEKEVDGIKVVGSRRVHVISVGERGNGLPITVTAEQWFSPELGGAGSRAVHRPFRLQEDRGRSTRAANQQMRLQQSGTVDTTDEVDSVRALAWSSLIAATIPGVVTQRLRRLAAGAMAALTSCWNVS